MRKKLLSIITASLVITACQYTFAQDGIIPNRGCATMEYKQWEEQQDPSIKINRTLIENQMKEAIENNKTNPSTKAVIIIPIVFHIVYNGASQNVSDACIAAQLKVLNDDFRKLNSDWTKVTQPGWSSLVADCEIQFCMAVRDPNNNPTNGITRTSTTKTSFGTNNSVKYTAQGGKDVWNRDKYFNVWVCNIGSGLLGYAQFPGGSAATDGLVIAYNYMVGSAGCGTAPYNLGRTATHELGHCFGLYHIWGDDGSACSGSDGITDTPNQAGEHYGCFTAGSVQTDACTGSSPGTMWMNYMDYTDDACMYMFTAGQKAALVATMNGPRAPLKTSNGCTPLTGVEYLISSESISLFPNPSAGDVTMNIDIPNISSADVSVFNALGESVIAKQSVAANTNVKLNMNGKPEGIYFVKISTQDGAVTKKIVLNK